MRSGDEPVNARSPLRLRLWLAAIGAACGIAGAVIFLVAGEPPLVALFAVLLVVALVDVAVVRHRIRQGPHFQPGPDVPPYHPAHQPAVRPRRRFGLGSVRNRRRWYLGLMGLCLGLLAVGWGVVRLVSTPATVAMTVVAMVIPPIAAIVANAGSQPPEDG